jgi:hypothetical protein
VAETDIFGAALAALLIVTAAVVLVAVSIMAVIH